MANLISDFGRSILAVVSRLQAYITGGFFAAIAFVYEHLSAKMISAQIVLWGVAGFFAAGAFMAWREQYRAGSPIGIRDRLDDLIERDDVLLDMWTSKKKKPKRRSKRWVAATRSFAGQHLALAH